MFPVLRQGRHLRCLSVRRISLGLAASEAVGGKLVDIFPLRGSAVIMATRAASGKIVDAPGSERLPRGVVRSRQSRRAAAATYDPRTILIDVVHAKNFVVYGLKRGKNVVTLGDFGPAPFTLQLPLGTIAMHHAAPAVAAGGGGSAHIQPPDDDLDAAFEAFGEVVDAVEADHATKGKARPSERVPATTRRAAETWTRATMGTAAFLLLLFLLFFFLLLLVFLLLVLRHRYYHCHRRGRTSSAAPRRRADRRPR